MRMIWKSKKPPQYIWIDDAWEREEDHKIFKSDHLQRFWKSEDNEIISWNKKDKLMDIGLRE